MRRRAGMADTPTPREFDVLYCVARDMTNPEIAMELHITEGTVKQHIRNLFDRLNVHTRTGLVIVALLRGHLKLEDFSISGGLINGVHRQTSITGTDTPRVVSNGQAFVSD